MKITKPAGQELQNRLEEVLSIVHAKRPLLEYESERTNTLNEITSVNVWQDGQHVGKIDSNFRRYSQAKGANEVWFAVTSPNIKKERGANRNMKFAKDAKIAARIVIETFTKKSLAELGVSLIVDVKSRVESLHQNVLYSFNNCVNISKPQLIRYFADLHSGKSATPPQAILAQYDNPEVWRKIENMDIADNVLTHLKSNNGYAIRIMKDETIMFAPLSNHDATAKYASTYELPIEVQEKFTMLKLLDAGQFASDIGIKYEKDDGDKKDLYYFIVAGETKVM
jgi:hypothetical protein